MGSPGTGRPQLGGGRHWGLPGRCPHLTPGAQSTSPCPWDPQALLRAQRFPGLGPSAAGLSMEMEPSPSLVYLGHVAEALRDTI